MGDMIRAGLGSGNVLVRASVGVLIVFGSLYVLDSFGAPGMFGVALLVGIGVLIANERGRTNAAYGQ